MIPLPKSLAALCVLAAGACANSPVAIHDRYNSGLLVELNGTSATPAQLGFVTARELYVIAPELGNGRADDAKSAIVFLQNGYDRQDGYFLRHGVATGAAATNLATKNAAALRDLQNFVAVATLSEEENEARQAAHACVTRWLETVTDEAAGREIQTLAESLGWKPGPRSSRDWLVRRAAVEAEPPADAARIMQRYC